MKEVAGLDGMVVEMIEGQKRKLLEVAGELVEGATWDDILQPFDFPELESNPAFRYEEGILAGMQMVQTAMRSK